MASQQISQLHLSVKKLDNLYFDGLVQKEDLKPTVGQFLKYVEDHKDFSNEDKKILAVSNLKSFAKEDIKTKLKQHNWTTMKKYLFDQYRCQLTLKEKIELRRYLIQREEESVNAFHDRCIKAQYMLCDDNADLVFERDIILNFISGIKEEIYQIIIRIEPLSTLDLCLKNAKEIEELVVVNDIEDQNYLDYDNENTIDNKNYIEHDNGSMDHHFMSEFTQPEETKVEVKLEQEDYSFSNEDHLFVNQETGEDFKSEIIESKPLKEYENDILPDEVLLENDQDMSSMDNGDNDPSDPDFEPTEEELKMVKPKIAKESICLICSYVCSSERFLQKHLTIIHNQDVGLKTWTCEICGKKLLESKREKIRHMRSKHPEHYKTLEDKVCELCPKSKHRHFTPLAMALHKNFFHPIIDPSPKLKRCRIKSKDACRGCKNRNCRNCVACKDMERYGGPGRLKQACVYRKCTNPKNGENLLCHTCRQSFSVKDALRRHIKVDHFNMKLPQCDICLRDFASKTQLKGHFEKSLCKKEAIFKCEHCTESFKSQRILHEHGIKEHPNLVVHANMKIPCEVCGKITPKHMMKTHMNTTHSDQIFICDQCGRGFKREAYVTEHKERAHMSKTIKCSVEGCDTLFSTKKQMNFHIKACHSIKKVIKRKEKNIICDQCPYRASNNKALAGHKASMHGGPKPYKCKEIDCDYEACHKSTLDQHVNSKHRNIMFECIFPGCGLKKNGKGNMDKHMKFSHGIPLPSERKKQKFYIDGTEDDIMKVDSGLSPTSQKPSSYYLQRRSRLT